MGTKCIWLPRVLAALLAGVAAAAPLAAQPQIVPLGPARVWQRAEFRVEQVPEVANPFDPDLIRVDATFTSPSGQSLTVPAFWYQAFARTLVGGAEALAPVGAPEWRIRFTPAEPGGYALALAVQVNGGAVAPTVTTHFSVAAADPAAAPGWVRLAANQRDLETSDGRPLRLAGANVCWPEKGGTFDYDRWLGTMRGAGEDFARLWMSPWWADLEQTPGTLNRYDLKGAWQLDHVFQQAEQDGIYLLLCLDFHGMFQTSNRNWGGSNNFWPTNPYNRANGGPCARPNDFLTSAAARAIYQKRLRYLVGRYGYSPRLVAWELFNEVDNVIGPALLNASDVVAWHREMGQWLHAHDPYRHLVTTSLTGGSDRPDIWAVPELDFSSYHSYGEAGTIRSLPALARSFIERYRKPVMIGEFGVDSHGWNLAADPYLRGFRQGLWAGALGGSVGSSMPWWWNEMDQNDVYPLYGAMTGFLRRAGWHDGWWSPLKFADPGEPPAKLGGALPNGEVFDAELALTPSWRSRPGNECAIANPLAASRSAERLAAFLLGRAHAAQQRPIRLAAWFGEKASATVHVNSVSTGARLVVRVDGDEVLRASIPDRDGSGTLNNEINQDYSAPIPPGRHVVEIANPGADWMFLDWIRLAQVRTAAFEGGWQFGPEAVGLRNGAKAALYVCSPWVVYPAGAHLFNPPRQSRQMVTLADWPDGRYSAQWYDPRTGALVGTTDGVTQAGSLALPLPEYREDLAGLVTAAENSAP